MATNLARMSRRDSPEATAASWAQSIVWTELGGYERATVSVRFIATGGAQNGFVFDIADMLA